MKVCGDAVKTGLLKKLLLFVVLIIAANALLTATVFTYVSRNVFANMKAEELIPKANFIGRMISQYQRGEISERALEVTLTSDTTLWDSTLHVFNAAGEIFVRSMTPGAEDMQEKLAKHLPDVLKGVTSLLVTTTAELGIVIGVPVYGIDASITGAVFLTKPLKEVNTALGGLNTALIVSCVTVLIITLLPAYIGSRGLIRPLRQMSKAARAMAAGDFSVYADETRKDETGALGRSLNELSRALSHTIGDLMLERNRLRNVLDGLNEGVVAVGADGAVTHCNPAAHRLLRMEAEDSALVYDRLLSFFPTAGGVLAAIGTGTIRTGGREIRVSVTELTGPGGGPFGAVAMLQDVTEEMRLERTRRDYVANVSHELRTPIASIRGLSEALGDGMVKNEDDKRRYYGYILRESMRLSRLIDDLLELSRLQSGGVALIRGAFDMRPVLMELKERFEATAGDGGLSFALRLDEGALSVYSNADRVEQVLIALLDNAVKYAELGGKITLAAKRREDALVLSVLSTGAIDEEHLPHLFERFYKADTAHAEQGTGLGLSIAREVAVLLGGHIWAENAGGEACFHLSLPVAADQENGGIAARESGNIDERR